MCGSELYGSEWEMKCVDRSCVGRSENWSAKRVDRRNEGDRPEKWADRTIFMSGLEWETKQENSPCVKCVDRGASSADRDWEMSGSELGASSLSVWIEASQALCACERAASSACERAEWKMFEVKIWAKLIFRLFCLILRSNWKYFQFDPIYRTYQTCYFPENDFWILFGVKTNGPLNFGSISNRCYYYLEGEG